VTSPFAPFLQAQAAVVLDGGLATTLEGYGFDLADPLWSARVLLESPDAVRRAHLEFLAAGADCIATATYQATHEGFATRGLTPEEADEVMLRAVTLAAEARDQFWADPANRPGRLRPLVAGSIGPYGAFLADGSEYSGDYGLTEQELYDFHARRWRVLAGSSVDLLACETIPSGPETRALLRLLGESPGRWAWLSFSCPDGTSLADGSAIAESARLCASAARVAAVGANCVAPSLVAGLVPELGVSERVPVAIYPNSGERYDAADKAWSEGGASTDLGSSVAGWLEQGVRVIGGCCRVDSGEIRKMRAAATLRHPPGSWFALPPSFDSE